MDQIVTAVRRFFLFFLLLFISFLSKGQVSPPACNTYTFKLEIPAPAGEKIAVTEVQPSPNRDFLVAGNLSGAAGSQGILLRTDAGGNIAVQKKLRIGNSSTVLFHAKMLLNGNVVISGKTNNGTQNVFVALLDPQLHFVWVNQFPFGDDVANTTLDLVSDSAICWAVQQKTAVVYSVLSLRGEIKWQKQTTVAGLDKLVGFGVLGWAPFGLVCNVTRAGLQSVVLTAVDQSDGTLAGSHRLNSGTNGLRCLSATSFNASQALLQVRQSGPSSFQLQRSINYASNLTETVHTYRFPFEMDPSATGAMDQPGDAMGVILPQNGKLLFLFQFRYYQTAPEFARLYDVPQGAALQSLTRSFDAGFLFGINTADSSRILLLKTDSIGTLPGCGSTSLQPGFTEVMNTNNEPSAEAVSNALVSEQTTSGSFTPAALTTVVDCRERFCPPAPADDSCLQTFYKSFRSASYADGVSSYHLLRNNRHLFQRSRYDRILGGGIQVTGTLEMFSERGQRLKGVTVHQGKEAALFYTVKMTDSTVMVVSYTPYVVTGGPPVYTFTLVNDELEILWSTSFESRMNAEFSNSGLIGRDLVRDNEGNYYFLSARSGGFMQVQPGVAVFKMNAAGQAQWLKAYAVNMDNSFGEASAAATASSLIVLVEGSKKGVSMRLDKNTGDLLSTYSFNNQYNGSGYNRLVKQDGNRIFYGGNTHDSHLLLGLFDTLGKATKMKMIESHDIIRGGDVKNGELYASYRYFNGTGYKDALLKVDSALNIVFLNEYDMHEGGMATGLAVSDDGAIYVAGNNAWGTNAYYFEPYLKKFSAKGELGTCSFQQGMPVITDIVPQVTTLTGSPLTITFQTPTLPEISFVPDTADLAVSAIYCSSVATCSFLNVTGPTALCDLSKPYTFKFLKETGCTIRPLISIDTAFAAISAITDTTVQIRFKKAGTTWIKGKLNAGCKQFSDSLQLQLSNAPATLDLGGDKTLCTGNTIVLTAQNGFFSYLWQDGSTASGYSVTTPGVYHVKTTDACGAVFHDTVRVTGAPPIPFNAGPDRVKCNQDTLRLSAPSGFLNYTWSNNYNISSTTTQDVIINPVVDTAYYLKAEKTPGCFAYDTVRVRVFRSPAIQLGADRSFCAGDSALLDAGSGFSSYRWSTGQSSQQLVVKAAGEYTVSGTTAQGCNSRDTVKVVDVFALPQAHLDRLTGLCQGESKTLDAGAFSQYQWQDGSTVRTYTAHDVGSYWVTVTDNHGCKGSDTTAIPVQYPLPSGFLPAETALCSYSSVVLKPVFSYTSYLWNTGGNTSSITVEKPGLYWLQVRDQNGCTGKDSVLVISKDCMSGVYFPTAFTPNSDGKNDVFRPLLFGKVKQYTFTIYNRWGQVVFQTSEVGKGWNGKVAGTPQETGVFAWTCTFQFEGGEVKNEKGIVTVIR